MIDVSKAARLVRETVPFYAWLYDDRGVTDAELAAGKIPVVSKNDFWRYEERTGKLYFASPRVPEEEGLRKMLHTSGTTSRILSVPVTDIYGRGTELVYHGLEKAMATYLGVKPIAWLQSELPPGLLAMIDLSVAHSGGEFRFISSKLPIREQAEQAKAAGCNGLLDISGLLSVQLVKERLVPLDYGIRLIAATYLTRGVVDYLKQHGTEVIYYFAAADALVAHVSCPHCPRNRFHIRSEISLHEVLTDSGRVERHGEGLYVTTAPHLPFPLVLYTTGDRVVLGVHECACGFKGTDLDFMERGAHVKLGSGPLINVEGVHNHYAAQPSLTGVTLVFGQVADEVEQQYRLCLFLESDVTEPREVVDGWKEVMRVGVGALDPTFAHHIRVFMVPQGLLEYGQENKRRLFVNLAKSSHTATAQSACRLVEQLTGERLGGGQ
jgi:hypothetical protein